MPDPNAILPVRELRRDVEAIKSTVYQKHIRPGKDQDFLSAMHHMEVYKKELKGSRKLVRGFVLLVKQLEKELRKK